MSIRSRRALAASYSATMLAVVAGNIWAAFFERARAMFPAPPRPVVRAALAEAVEDGASRPATEVVLSRVGDDVWLAVFLILPMPPRPVERWSREARVSTTMVCEGINARKIKFGNPSNRKRRLSAEVGKNASA
jgi:hypothetical protein